ncbi:MAG: H-NS histone family protein [Pseudomonadota bacterium]
MAVKKLALDKLSLDELKTLQKDVERAIGDFKKRKRGEAMKEIQAVAKKHGLSVDDIVGGKAKGRKAKAPAKYRNPKDASQEWSGRGRQPAWFKEAVSAGKKPQSMEI